MMALGWLIDKPIIKTKAVLDVANEAHLRTDVCFQQVPVEK